MKILWYVQNVLGIGHISRTLKICKAFTDAQICLVTGGKYIPLTLPDHIQHVHIPGLLSNTLFTELHPEDESCSLEKTWSKRKNILSDLLFQNSFDLIVTEVFPFGRGQFRKEILHILELNKYKKYPAKIACSLRDINILMHNPNFDPKRMASYANLYYSKILVHADSRFSHFQNFFPIEAGLLKPVIYTGYITDTTKLTRTINQIPKIVLSIGGGQIVTDLLNIGIEASINLFKSCVHELDIFCGPYINSEIQRHLESLIKHIDHICLYKFDQYLNQKWNQYDLSLNLGGYNTILELMGAGIPSIVYPFNVNHEQESRLRELNTQGQFTVLNSDQLNASCLEKLILSRINDKSVYQYDLDMNGIQTTITHLKQLI